MNSPKPDVRLIPANSWADSDVEIFIYRNGGREYLGRVTADGNISLGITNESLDVLDRIVTKIWHGDICAPDWKPTFK